MPHLLILTQHTLNMSTAIYLVLVIATIALISRRLWIPRRLPQAAQPEQPVSSGIGRISDPLLCRQLIECKTTQDSELNRLSLLKSRAEPNQRLRSVFNIDNAFTSSDTLFVERFVREARQRIKLRPDEWLNLSLMLLDISRKWISIGFNTESRKSWPMDSVPSNQPGSLCSDKLDITSLVQVLTLKATLATVLKREAKDCPNDFEMLHLAQQINKGWIQSKKDTWACDDSTGNNFEHNDPLKTSLKALFPQVDHERNPLNFLLPSFETMWRVVLRTLLELKFQSGRDHAAWAKAIKTFCREATKAEFERRPTLRGGLTTTAVINGDIQLKRPVTPSAKDIVMEALRLYPPTRRIYRGHGWDDAPVSYGPGQFCDVDAPSRTSSKTIAADIEACHLRTDIWGPDAAKFDPGRWMNITPAQRCAFLPFGYGVCECPAKSVFGPWMIAILVGALLSALDDDGWTLFCAEDRVMSCLATKERLRLERDAYVDLKIIRSSV